MLIAMGGLCVTGGTAGVVTDRTPFVGGAQLVFGGALLVAGIRLRRFTGAVQLVNQAYDRAQRGESSDADALLDDAARRSASPMLQRAMAVQRAWRAIDRGDLEHARKYVDEGLEVRLGLNGRMHAAMVRAELTSTRAVLRAAHGDAAGARHDAVTVRQTWQATPDALANAALADVLALRIDGVRESVRAALHEHRLLVLEHARPAFRAIMRAVWHSAHLGVSPYRSAPAGDRTRFRELVRAVLGPDRREDVNVEDDMVPPLAGGAVTVPAAADTSAGDERTRPKTPARRGFVLPALVIWVLLIVTFLVAWQFLQPSGRAIRGDARAAPALSGTMLASMFAGAFAAFMTVLVWIQRRGLRRLLAASRAGALGNEREARDVLTVLRRSRFPLISAQADLELANLEIRGANFEAALDVCEAGIRALSSRASRRVAYDALLPRLHAARAYLLAGLDRPSEAEKEIARLERDYPAFYNLANAVHRARLMLAIRRRDFAAAAELEAARGPELGVGYREEMLGELAQVLAHGAPREHVRRLHSEIREMPELNAWLERMAPATLGLMQGATAESASAGAR